MIKRNPKLLKLVFAGATYVPSINLLPGGGGNVAFGLKKLGSMVHFIGKVGDDFLGMQYRTNLESEGITTNILIEKSKSTGILVTFVDDVGERSFLISRGANDYLVPEEVDSIANFIKKSKFLYINGFSLVNEPQKSAILTALRIAKRKNVKIVFDPGSFNIIQENFYFFNQVINLCDVLIPNIDEAKSLSKCEKLDDVINYFSNLAPLTVIKLGDQGCVAINSKKTIKANGFQCDCFDSSGCGDAFVSAIIFGLSKNMSLGKILKLANWYASFVAQAFGPRNFPEKQEINTFLQNL